MLARLLIVVLLFLNAGVGLWWWWRAPVAAPSVAIQATPGVPELSVLDEAHLPLPAPQAVVAEDAAAISPEEGEVDAMSADDVAQVPETPAVLPVAAAPVCAGLTGFADTASVSTARNRLAGLVDDIREQAPTTPASGPWKVMIAPAKSREQAEQTARRIAAAGFSDLFVIQQGDLRHGVALGQFRNRDGAQRRLDALSAAGFPAVMTPASGAVEPPRLLVRGSDPGLIDTLRGRLGKSIRVESIDCRALR